MKFQSSWNETDWGPTLTLGTWFSVAFISREKTHAVIHTLVQTHSEGLRAIINSLCFGCFWSPVHKKAGWLNIYRQNFPLNQWAGLGQQRLGLISQHLDSYRSPQPTPTTWTHHAPQEPASPYPPATESSTSISLRALSSCLFSQIVTKGRGRWELYLFTTWWHHL